MTKISIYRTFLLSRAIHKYREKGVPVNYCIVVGGHIDQSWSACLLGLSIFYENDFSILTGPLPDQSALYGVLLKLRDLNLTLISLERLEVHHGYF
jgi:hypothetical protein